MATSRALGAALLGAVCATSAVARNASGPVVQTHYGAVQGVVINNINDFLGIPYATPPVGPLRWTAPTPPAPWTNTLQATSYGAYCTQGFSEIGPGGGSENCLFLNVQTPAAATATSNLPVMVWIHGGALSTGSGQEYDGTSLINSGNVVYVSFNYRLGLLGFMGLPALAQQDAHGSSGNYGLLDQQAAIAWVRQNIAAFGGNPNKITIFGESAGGQSTIDQLVSPLLGHVSSAIIESGAYARALPTQAQAQSQGQAVATSLNCAPSDLACLRAVPATALVSLADSSSTITIAPNVDGYVLPQQPFLAFAAGAFPHIPSSMAPTTTNTACLSPRMKSFPASPGQLPTTLSPRRRPRVPTRSRPKRSIRSAITAMRATRPRHSSPIMPFPAVLSCWMR